MVRKYITKKSINEFAAPPKLPANYEDEILDAFANYSLESDMKLGDISSFLDELRVPRVFVVGNKRLRAEEIAIEDTDIVDFDKLLIKTYHLLLFRDNRELIESTWLSLVRSLGNQSRSSINLADLKRLDKELKLGISDALLLDMVAVGADGKGVEVNMTDFGYVLGKIGHLEQRFR